MNRLLTALAAGLFTATASAVSAMPLAKAAQAGEPVATKHSALKTVDYKDRRRMLHKRDGRHGRYARHRGWYDGDRYSRYRGWDRYYDRPRGWRSRGCVSVGPIWFCP